MFEMSIRDWFDQDKLDADYYKRQKEKEELEEFLRKKKGLKKRYGPPKSPGNGGATQIALLNMLSTSPCGLCACTY